nr:hypothetical protein GCM10020092_064040 [Actinoplanes digitatis]
MHLLLLSTPKSGMFFAWIVSLATLAAMLAPFAVKASQASQFATAALNLVLGIAIGSLVSGSARSAVRKATFVARPPFAGPPVPDPMSEQRVRAAAEPGATGAQVWLARAAFALALAAAVVLVAFAGRKSLVMVALAAAGVVLFVAAAFWVLAGRGVLQGGGRRGGGPRARHRPRAAHPGGAAVGGPAVARAVRARDRRRAHRADGRAASGWPRTPPSRRSGRS